MHFFASAELCLGKSTHKENAPEETSGAFSGWLSGFGVGISLTNIDYDFYASVHMGIDVIFTVELYSQQRIAFKERSCSSIFDIHPRSNYSLTTTPGRRVKAAACARRATPSSIFSSESAAKFSKNS